MRLRRVLSIGLLAVLIAPTAAVAAYRDIFYDPNDVESRPDIRSTTRRVSVENGLRVLKVVVRSYGEWPVHSFVEVKLDTRGGPLVDARLQLFNRTGPDGDSFCAAVRNNHNRVVGALGQYRDREVCWVPTRFFQPNKRIRWKVKATPDGVHHPDYAPNDRGWYE